MTVQLCFGALIPEKLKFKFTQKPVLGFHSDWIPNSPKMETVVPLWEHPHHGTNTGRTPLGWVTRAPARQQQSRQLSAAKALPECSDLGCGVG